MKQKLFSTAGVLLVTVAYANASLTIGLNTTVNGDTPTGTSPFATAVFTTSGANSVTLAMTNNMPSSNFITNWLFNLSSVVPMTVTHVSGNVATVTQGQNHTNGTSAMKAGKFDLAFSWPTSNSNPNRFSGGETSVYTLSGAGITENSFAALSVADGNNPGGFYSAAKVQGFGSSGTVGAPVPEPSAFVAGFVAIAGLALASRKRK